jgi:hypothetical protein
MNSISGCWILLLHARVRIFKLLRNPGNASIGGDGGSDNEKSIPLMGHGRLDSLLCSYSIPGIDFPPHNLF